ncbi:hypothetical protein V8F06_001364 [Rhypophila decipiens]
MKRRGYLPDEGQSPERGLEVLTQSSPISFDLQSLSGAHDYILRTAPITNVTVTISLEKLLDYSEETHHELLNLGAKSLDVPAHILHQLSFDFRSHRRHHRARPRPQPQPQPLSQLPQQTEFHPHKRLRLDTSDPMPVPYSDSPARQADHEKPLLSGQPGGQNEESPSIQSGWSSSRIADCLASFAICPPYTTSYETAYQPLPTSEAYCYGQSRPALDNGVVSLQPQSQLPPNPAALAAGQPDMFPCDDPSMMAHYLPTYPPMQPTQAPGMQPTTSREGMAYPTTSAIDRYPGNNEANRAVTGLGIQDQISPLAAPVGPSPMPTPYPVDGGSPAFGQYNGFASLPGAPFNPQDRYPIKVEQDAMDAYGRPLSYDLFQHQKTLPAKRGPFKDNEQRLATARTRKKGSCIRCRMQRIRCVEDEDEGGGPCIPCRKITSNSRIYRLNCLRWKITDVKLFKPGQVKGLEWTLRWKDSVVDDIGSWASSESRFIYVTEGYTGRGVKLQVRRFQPQQGDRLERSWYSNGQKRTKEIPAFAIVDMDAAKKSFDDYIKNGLVACCERILGSPGELLYRTYSLALKAMQDPTTSKVERDLLTTTLDLWMSVRLTTKSFEIIGNETLGMNRQEFEDDSNPLKGKIPLPPVMGAQIDSILIHQVQPQLRRTTLEELQKMTQEKKQKTWLITYLVTFILLHNIALITRHDAEYAKKHGMKGRWARECNVKEYNLGANTLLAYFHYCNKGIYPFSSECRDQDLQTLAELDDDAIELVKFTRDYVLKQKEPWAMLLANEKYEDEYYYVSQLFEQNWQPRTMV